MSMVMSVTFVFLLRLAPTVYLKLPKPKVNFDVSIFITGNDVLALLPSSGVSFDLGAENSDFHSL
jgi:hypothetical protein